MSVVPIPIGFIIYPLNTLDISWDILPIIYAYPALPPHNDSSLSNV